ncbi:MAG: DUF547 domain-containing protein [Planctomycetes bacterium]|nr:DUF547 domain-containing protein [Planctomycetota bacterium]
MKHELASLLLVTTLQTTMPLQQWNETLAKHVTESGEVNYAAIKKEPAGLDAYILWLGELNIDALPKDNQLANLLNAYNAFTIKLITEHWPIESIKDIPVKKRWVDKRWKLAGKLVSLDDIEHTMIRPVFEQPEIHFALVCGADGCPPLPNKAFIGKTLKEQLHDQIKKTHSSKGWYRYDQANNTLYISKIYRWYSKDFTTNGRTIQEFIAQYDTLVDTALKTDRPPKVKYLLYDWSINNFTPKPASEAE